VGWAQRREPAGRIGGVLAVLSTYCNTLQYTATHCNTLQHTIASLPCRQEKEEGSKRRRRIDVRGGAVEGEWEEGGLGKTTLTQYRVTTVSRLLKIIRLFCRISSPL